MTYSRRAFLRTAAWSSLGALAAPAFADETLQSVIQAKRRGSWDDQFDSRAINSASAVATNTPIFGPDTVVNLEQAIETYRQIVLNGGWPQVRPSVPLKLGVTNPEVQRLRQRLIISGDLPRSAGMSDTYDSFVDGAVKRFQARHGLPQDGMMGKFTLDAMNVPADIRLLQLEKNLERVREIDTDLGPRYVMVNIPAAYIEAVENGRVVQRHTAIVGRISRPTHIIDSKIYEVILNPYWTSPRSIIQKDIMPLMRENPQYLAENKIRLFDGQGNEVAPETVDWNAEKAPNLMFRQDPGPHNAMASTKINFHNPHGEYMHDTPQQGLFNKLARFESSGCVRVQNVRDLTSWLLRDTPGWSRQQIEATIKSGENTPIQLAQEVAVSFKYVTAWSAKDRIVQFRDDIYAMDGADQLALQTGLNQEQAAN